MPEVTDGVYLIQSARGKRISAPDDCDTYSEYEVFWDSSPYSASPDNHDSMYVYYSTDGETWTLWGTTSASLGNTEVSALTAGQTY